MKNQKMFTVQVDNDLLQAFKIACNKNDRTASQIVRDFMRNYVAEHSNDDDPDIITDFGDKCFLIV